MDRTDMPELPALDPGVQLLETDGERAVGPLAALVLDHVLGGGTARWIDSRGHAQTAELARIAPDGWALDRVQVARGFTAHQHVALVGRTRERAEDTDLLVLPAMDAPYRDGVRRGRRFLLRSLARVAAIAREHAVPVLVTRSRADAFAAPLATAADRTIRCRRTDLGPRFVTDEFETLVYPDGAAVQTTLAFWRRVVAARGAAEDGGAAADSAPTAAREVTAGGAH